MPAKKQITAKVPVPKKPVPKKTLTTKRAAAAKTAPGAAGKPKTPSLVSAVPLSNISPRKPEQLLYEPELSADPAKTTVTAAEPPVVKRGRGRPRKTEAAVAPPAIETTPEAMPQPAAPQPAATPAPAVSSPQTIKRRRGLRLNHRLLAALTVVVILAAGGWYWHKTHTQNVAAANAQLIAEIAQHVVLPQGETPTISTVVDETKVNQEFLKNAKKGDKVLLYFQSSQAIVYRPSTGQVVNMGPLQTPQPRVFIRQGSTADNVSVVKNIVSRTNEFLVTSTDQSAKKDYTKTIVVDLTGNRPDLAGHLAQLLHVNVGNLPAGEDPPDADLMVIVGSDYK